MRPLGSADEAPTNLLDLPAGPLVIVCQILVEVRNGSPRDVISLALASKALRQAITAADDLWLFQCKRLGWSLDWLPLCRPPTTWTLFSQRMLTRWRLRGQLRRTSQFLDPLSRACLQPRAGPWKLEQAEAALQLRLPWELAELFSWADGQELRPGVHFADGARLLSLAEMQGQMQHEQGPAALHKAFRAWMAGDMAELHAGGAPCQSGTQGKETAGQDGPGPSAYTNAGAGGVGSCHSLPGMQSISAGVCSSGWQSGSSAGRSAWFERKQAPTVLLPFTDVLRGGRQMCVDFGGRVWRRTGFNSVLVAESLVAFFRGTLQ